MDVRWRTYGRQAGMPWIPEVEAVCGKAAHTDLCGGRGVIPVPTATGADAAAAAGCRIRESRRFFAVAVPPLP
jgi:hypothetical protein